MRLGNTSSTFLLIVITHPIIHSTVPALTAICSTTSTKWYTHWPYGSLFGARRPPPYIHLLKAIG